MFNLSYIRLIPISWSQEMRWYPGNNGIGDDEGGYLRASCRAKADSKLVLRNDAKLRDFHIPISVARGSGGLEEKRQKSRLGKEAIGGLWYVDDQNFVHGWFHFNDQTFAALWDQVLHGKYTSCEFCLGVEPVRDDVWNHNNPLSIVSASVNFYRSSLPPDKPKPEPERPQAGFFARLRGGR